MATVTGFTAERMLEIENTTVVDGEVVGNDLHLLQRDGTPINAGNVRGPQGTQGPPGPVPSVNDQTGAVYSPRIFTNKAALDAWTTAPNGAYAFTTADGNAWIKAGGAWQSAPPPRVFTNKAALDAGWGSAPDGSMATTTTEDAHWFKDPSGWILDQGIRVFASVTDRDTRWPSPPDGVMCQAPAGTNWYRIGGAWKADTRMLSAPYYTDGNWGSNLIPSWPGITFGSLITPAYPTHWYRAYAWVSYIWASGVPNGVVATVVCINGYAMNSREVVLPNANVTGQGDLIGLWRCPEGHPPGANVTFDARSHKLWYNGANPYIQRGNGIPLGFMVEDMGIGGASAP